jgi:hypothetical protein
MSFTLPEVPPDWEPVYYLNVTEPRRKLLLLNIAALIMVFVGWFALGIFRAWYERISPPGLPLDFTVSTAGEIVFLIGAVILLLPLHEWLHGVSMQLLGVQPRYGWKLTRLVFFATADGALFRRNAFLIMALAPLIGITLLGMLALLTLPSALAQWAAPLTAANIGASLGDMLMAAIALRYPSNIYVRDEEDAIRIFAPTEENMNN